MPTRTNLNLRTIRAAVLLVGLVFGMHHALRGQEIDFQALAKAPRVQIAPGVFHCNFAATNGRPVSGELFIPKSPGRHPAVVLLHGGMGVQLRAAAFYLYASALSARGYVAFVPHYFEGAERNMDNDPDEGFVFYLATVGKAVDFIADQPEVDAQRIGLIGFSWGGTFAIAEAANDLRVKAIVDYYGYDTTIKYSPEPRRLPPTLIVWGDRDQNVPIARARELEALLERLNGPHEMKIYHGYAHMFDAQHPEDAWSRSLRFLGRHLGTATGTRSARPIPRR